MSLLTMLGGLLGLLARDSKPVSDPPPPPPPQMDVHALYAAIVGMGDVAPTASEPLRLYTTRPMGPDDAQRIFAPAKPPPGVVPAGIALDSLNNPMDMAGYAAYGGLTEGMHWLGFPYLAQLAQRTEYRRISETIAKDMTRRWFRIQATGDDDKTDKIKALEELIKQFKLQEKFTLLALLDGFFGRAHLYIDTGDTDDRDILKLPLPVDPRMILKGGLKGVRVIEPMWAYPTGFNAQDPLKEGFYLPQTWWVMGKEIHHTRILPFVGREMPDMMKPAYSFAGLSLSQMAKPYVDNWLRTRQSISDLIHSFSTPVMMTNMGSVLNAGASTNLKIRATLFNYLRDNNNMMILDKNTEDFKNVSTPIGGLDHLQAQSQEHMASAVGIPLVVLLGISPSGLNATSEGELQVWAQFIHAAQGSFFDAHLTSLLKIFQLHLFGEIDPAITHAWEPLRELSEEEKSTAEKTQADIDAVYINAGVLSPDEIRQRLSGEADSPYQGLDLDTPAPPPPNQEMDPLGGGGMGGPGGGMGGPGGVGGVPTPANDPHGGGAAGGMKPAGGSAGPVPSGAGKIGTAGSPKPPKDGTTDEEEIAPGSPNSGHTMVRTQDPNAQIHVHMGPNDRARIKLGQDGAFYVAADAYDPNEGRAASGEWTSGGGSGGGAGGGSETPRERVTSGEVDLGNTTGYVNPSRTDMAKMLQGASVKELRGLYEGNKFVVWPSNDALHQGVQRMLKMSDRVHRYIISAREGSSDADRPYQIGRFAAQIRRDGNVVSPKYLPGLLRSAFGVRGDLAGDEWNEADHPRGQPENAGEFGPGGGAAAPKTESHSITGLPPGKLPRELARMNRRGGYEMSAVKLKKGEFDSSSRYEVTVTAKAPANIKTVGEGHRAFQYDPKLAEIETLNADEPTIARKIGVVKKGLPDRLPIKRNDEHMYRGMDSAEFEDFQKTGQIKSKADYNMGGQEGLTYWSTDPDQAESYANSFAPAEHKPTFDKPAYVMVAKRVGPEDETRVPGTGANEIGVKRPVEKADVVEIWRGRVAVMDAGGYSVTDRDGEFEGGSGSSPRADVVWEKVGQGEMGASKAPDGGGDPDRYVKGGAGGKRMTVPDLEDFYQGFGFKRFGRRDKKGYAQMIRQPQKSDGGDRPNIPETFKPNDPPTGKEQDIINSGDKITRPDKSNYPNKVDHFLDDLPIYDQWVRPNTTWQFMQTPKGIATVSFNKLNYSDDKPSVEAHWLVAEDRGAGRAAMDMITKAADRHGVKLQLYAVPLAPHGAAGEQERATRKAAEEEAERIEQARWDAMDDDDLAGDEWIESEHPRGQPENRGEFAPGGGGGGYGGGGPAHEPDEPQHTAAPAAPKQTRARAAPRPAPAPEQRRVGVLSNQRHGVEFYSPSVEEHMDLTQATAGLHSERQHLLNTAAGEIDQKLGLHATNHDAIGAWSDGAENSIMTEMDGGSWDELRASVAMKASLANQKDVLVFQEAEGGKEHLFSFQAAGSVEKIHQDLLADGVAFHTIVPTQGGATVYAVDMGYDGDATSQAVLKAAERYGTTPTDQAGKAEFLVGDNKGTTAAEQRHIAQLAYGKVIDKSGVPDLGTIWKGIRPTYGQAFEVTEYPKEETTTPLPGSDPNSHPAIISTRRPTAVGASESDKYRRADLAGMQEDRTPGMKPEDDVFARNMDLITNANAYPQFREGEFDGKTPEEIARIAIDFAKSNLRFLYEHAPAKLREQGHLWYEGAHNFAAAKAKEYNIPLQSAAAVYAALSPQKLWAQNVKQGDTLLDVYFNHRNDAWSDAMTTTAARIWKKPQYAPLLSRIRGKKLAQLQLPAEKAMWIRTYSEAHDKKQQYDQLTPDGKVLGLYYKLNGEPAKNTWQNLSAISNAITALESGGNRDIISISMGDRNKVRSFYNNILDPSSGNEDVTMDTHAVGAVLLTPATANSTSVAQSLKTSPMKGKREVDFEGARGSTKSGSQGTYGLWADAYRELAHELNIEPRVLQSMTWEAKRKLFDSRMTKKTVKGVRSLWREYHHGDRSLEKTQQAVWDMARGIEGKPEDGAKPPAGVKQAKRAKRVGDAPDDDDLADPDGGDDDDT